MKKECSLDSFVSYWLWCEAFFIETYSAIQVISLRKSNTNSPSDLIWMSSFAGPSYLTNRSSVYIILIWDPYIFNLYNLWQTRCIYIRRKPRQCGLHFNEQITRTHFLLLQPYIRPVPAQVILLWKGPSKPCIECHLVPLWAFPPKSPGLLNVESRKPLDHC